MTQYEADLRYWTARRNATTNFVLWRIAQERIDGIFMAMGYGHAPLAAVVEEEFAFPRVKAWFAELREAGVAEKAA